MADNCEREEECGKQELIKEVCNLFESVKIFTSTSPVDQERVLTCPAPLSSTDTRVVNEDATKPRRRRRRRRTVLCKYSSSEEETASDESVSVLMDLLIWFDKREQGKYSNKDCDLQTDSAQRLQESSPGQGSSVISGAVPKKKVKAKSKSKQLKCIEDGGTSNEVTNKVKQEARKLKQAKKEIVKLSQQSAEEKPICVDRDTQKSPSVPVQGGRPVENKSPSKQTKKKQKSSHLKNTNKEELTFKNYLLEEELRAERENGCLIEGVLRINPRNFKEAYINSPDKGQDILIDGIRNRNRALEGDEVIVRLTPSDQRKVHGSDTQKAAEVVFIKYGNHPRIAVGTLKPLADKNPNFALFSPRDSRVPRIRIPIAKCPENFLKNVSMYSEILFVARITSWLDVRYAVGELVQYLGNIGDKNAETASILVENEIDVSPYPESFKQFYPQTFIIEEELGNRIDLRKECIFTIDPLTARDLDDALSCKQLGNGNFEVGVHISDVAHFLAEGTPLDAAVSKRATTTYLVDEVFHMLPRELCMLCSLLPGEDRLAFSVFWELNADAEVLSHRFARSVINSCVQLAYEHAQEMIERPDKERVSEELPTIHNGFSPGDLDRTVLALHGLATKLRGRRFSSGALRIDQTKLTFSLDPTLGLPYSFSQHVNKESHRMIEEFMLLANMTVAQRLRTEFPDVCFLRAHAQPHRHMMKELQAMLGSVGIHLDVSSAGGLHDSLARYASTDDIYGLARMMVLNCLCAKPMARAKYFCGGFAEKNEDFWHYALNVPLYTHFTSPIRRYADVMVHRLLAAAVGYIGRPDWNSDAVQKIASNCNKQKFNAKRAGEQSSELFLALYVAQFGPLVQDAVVVDVKDHSFNVIVLSMGCNLRVYTNDVPGLDVVFHSEGKASTLQLHWRPSKAVPTPTTQIIQIFSVLKVMVLCATSSLKLDACLLSPELARIAH